MKQERRLHGYLGKLFLLLTFASFLLLSPCQASADLVLPNQTVSFYVFDGADAGSSVTLNFLSAVTGTLKYSYDNSSYFDVTNNKLTVTDVSSYKLLYLRLYDGSPYDNTGDLRFIGENNPSNLYNSIWIYWKGNYPSFSDITVSIPDGNDKLAPVPIPAAAWLLGSGLLGLVALRRRKK